MKSSPSLPLFLRTSSFLMAAGVMLYAVVAFKRGRQFRIGDALNVALVMDALYAGGKMLYRCSWDETFHPGEDLVLFLVIGAIALLILSIQSLVDIHKRM